MQVKVQLPCSSWHWVLGASPSSQQVLCGQPLHFQLNRIFCVQWCSLQLYLYFGLFCSTDTWQSSSKWTQPSTVFLGRYCIISFLKQKSSALKLNVLPRHEHVCGTEQGEPAMHQEGKDSAVSPGHYGPAPVPQGSAPRWLCLQTSISLLRCTRMGFAFALFYQMDVTATEKMPRRFSGLSSK